MAIRESLLNTITSVANSDFVRLVTSAGESSKATVANLFKSFESGLGAKSSLTTSDYIRVVGSDNNLYKQSVSSVKSAMGVSDLETEVDKLANKIQRNTSNITTGNSCTFNLVNPGPSYTYHYGILTGGTSASPYVAYVFLGTVSDGVRPVTVTAILPGVLTITGTATNDTVTFTVAAGNAYGGLRYIDLS